VSIHAAASHSPLTRALRAFDAGDGKSVSIAFPFFRSHCLVNDWCGPGVDIDLLSDPIELVNGKLTLVH